MQPIKLVLTDLDGTMVPPLAHAVSSHVLEVVRACKTAGVKICAVTGRPYDMAKPVFEQLDMHDLCVLDGGAAIQHPATGETVWYKWLPKETVRQAASILLPYCSMINYAPGTVNVAGAEASVDAIIGDSPGVWAAVPAAEADRLAREVNTIEGVIAYTNPGHGGKDHEWGVQVTHHEADKFHGVQQLLALLNIDKSQVLAIGDGNNDEPLFRAAGVKVAVDNATDFLKSQADYVVASVYDDGFAEAMERFVLPTCQAV